jgi:hypothetical protein
MEDGVPDNADGENGTYRINANTGVIYEKVAGVWTPFTATAPNSVIFSNGLPSAGTGINGDLAVLYTGGTVSGLAEKSGGTWAQIADSADAEKRQTDNTVIEVMDHFLSGPTITAASGSWGGPGGWLFLQTVGGTGSIKSVGNAGARELGVARIGGGASSGNAVCLYLSSGTDAAGPFTVDNVVRLTDFRVAFTFKVDTAGDFHMGFSNIPTSAAAPTRFAGVRARNGTTNFEFVVTDGSPIVVDSLIPVDTQWHVFEIRFDYDTQEWLFSLDGGGETRIARTIAGAGTVTLGWWSKTNAVAYQPRFADSFRLYGVLP